MFTESWSCDQVMQRTYMYCLTIRKEWLFDDIFPTLLESSMNEESDNLLQVRPL